MNRSYRTAKGTDLPLTNLRGKEYLEVKYRVVWFREEHPDWSIETELISVKDDSAYARATIKDQTGRIIATSHKYEDKEGFPDFLEKCETGSIGRALALCGYGTQFCAEELDEGNRIVDAPVEPRTNGSADAAASVITAGASLHAPTSRLGEYKVTFGKFKNKLLKDIDAYEIDNYIKYLLKKAKDDGRAIAAGGAVMEFIEQGEAYLKSLEPIGPQ